MFKGTILKRFRKILRHQRGFVLAELAVGMMIIGLLGTGLYQSVSQFQKWSRLEITKRNQDMVWKSLEGYLSQHGCLPFASTLGDQGKEGKKLLGYVPYVTLGIMPSVAKDGYGRWMFYAVDRQWTLKGHGQRQALCKSLFGEKCQLEVIFNDQSTLQKKNNKKKQGVNGIAALLFSGKKEDLRIERSGNRLKISCHASPHTRLEWRTRQVMARMVNISCFDVLFDEIHQMGVPYQCTRS